MSETPKPGQALSDAELNAKFAREERAVREGEAKRIGDGLTEALALLEKAKTEIAAGNYDSAWRTMEAVHSNALGAQILADRQRISLRLMSERQK